MDMASIVDVDAIFLEDGLERSAKLDLVHARA
jgi:hypothetical protein